MSKTEQPPVITEDIRQQVQAWLHKRSMREHAPERLRIPYTKKQTETHMEYDWLYFTCEIVYDKGRPVHHIATDQFGRTIEL